MKGRDECDSTMDLPSLRSNSRLAQSSLGTLPGLFYLSFVWICYLRYVRSMVYACMKMVNAEVIRARLLTADCLFYFTQ